MTKTDNSTNTLFRISIQRGDFSGTWKDKGRERVKQRPPTQPLSIIQCHKSHAHIVLTNTNFKRVRSKKLNPIVLDIILKHLEMLFLKCSVMIGTLHGFMKTTIKLIRLSSLTLVNTQKNQCDRYINTHLMSLMLKALEWCGGFYCHSHLYGNVEPEVIFIGKLVKTLDVTFY